MHYWSFFKSNVEWKIYFSRHFQKTDDSKKNIRFNHFQHEEYLLHQTYLTYHCFIIPTMLQCHCILIESKPQNFKFHMAQSGNSHLTTFSFYFTLWIPWSEHCWKNCTFQHTSAVFNLSNSTGLCTSHATSKQPLLAIKTSLLEVNSPQDSVFWLASHNGSIN